MTLCVPKIPSMSHDLRVFVDDTAGQVSSAGSERVKVCDGFGQEFEVCGLSGGAVLVVVDLVLSQQPQKKSLIPGQGAVEQVPPASADPPLHDRVVMMRTGSARCAFR